MTKREGREPALASRSDIRPTYSTRLRTALVLIGTGTAGAYHAGVLRAFREAGVKIDVVAGRGMGAASALFAAVDGDAQLWETAGIWADRVPAGFYRWRPAIVTAVVAAGVALGGLLAPPIVLAGALTIYGLGALLGFMGLQSGGSAAIGYARIIEQAFAPAALPTIIPRIVTVSLIVAASALVAAGIASRVPRRGRRHDRGSILWDAIGAPWNGERVIRRFRLGLWQLMRGAARLREPDSLDLSRRYAELVGENIGQPGFREVVVAVHDLDAKRDLTFALLSEPFRHAFFRPPGNDPERRAETFDLLGVARDHVVDALSGALTLPVLTDAHFVTFHPEGFWRGETHRLCDRPGATFRLLEDVAAASVEQVIVVAPCTQLAAPHGLTARRADLRARVGDYFGATEAATLSDATDATRHLFRSVFVIRPSHSAIGPFDFTGTYDERSDRQQPLRELLDQGYEDAYRQFIEPVVGASGERLEAGAEVRAGARSRGAKSHEETS